MLWIGDHSFEDAKIEGWIDAILIQVRNHPRAIRTMEFADHCDAVSSLNCPNHIRDLWTGAVKWICTLSHPVEFHSDSQ